MFLSYGFPCEEKPERQLYVTQIFLPQMSQAEPFPMLHGMQFSKPTADVIFVLCIFLEVVR